jgi:hypothetical protein
MTSKRLVLRYYRVQESMVKASVYDAAHVDTAAALRYLRLLLTLRR